MLFLLPFNELELDSVLKKFYDFFLLFFLSFSHFSYVFMSWIHICWCFCVLLFSVKICVQNHHHIRENKNYCIKWQTTRRQRCEWESFFYFIWVLNKQKKCKQTRILLFSLLWCWWIHFSSFHTEKENFFISTNFVWFQKRKSFSFCWCLMKTNCIN